MGERVGRFVGSKLGDASGESVSIIEGSFEELRDGRED